MSKSTWDDPRITAYVLGELSETERANFEALLHNDPELSAAVDEARLVTGQLSELYSAEPGAALESHRRDVINEQAGLGHAAEDQSEALVTPIKPIGPDESNGRARKPVLLVMATAAVILLMVGIVPWIRREQLRQQVSQLMDEAPPSGDAPVATSPRAVTSQLEAVSDRRRFGESDETTADSSFATSSSASGGQSDDGLTSAMSRSDEALAEAEPRRLYERQIAVTEGVQGPRLMPSSTPEKKAARGAETKTSRELRRRQVTLGQGNSDSQSSNSSAPDNDGDSLMLGMDGVDYEDAQSFSYQPSDQEMAEADFMEIPRAQASARPVKQESEEMAGRGALMGQEMMMQGGMGGGMEGGMRAMGIGGRVVTAESKEGKPALAKKEWGAPFVVPRQQGAQSPNYGLPIDEGRGPGIAGDRFEPIIENDFKRVEEHQLSTFSIDVDTASYSKTRDFLMRAGQWPRPDAVRIEELVNYFDYDYQPPSKEDPQPFSVHGAITSCPWNQDHRLARIALKGKTMSAEERPQSNLVFLLDTSGSMNAANKLPLVVDGMEMLIKQLDQDDRVAITVYAGSAGMVLDSTPAKKKKKIRKALRQLSAGGSTNGGAGISLAYQTARENFIEGGVNRVILCTDGDFNVGTTGTDELVRMVEKEAKGGIFLSVLGFGMGNHNDAMLEQISGRGNGNYAFIDNDHEARKVLVDQTSATLVTIAKDVKIQVDFNPRHVAAYRLIGYENRMLAKEDFEDDTKDAGEIGAGHAVTALYELVPAGVELPEIAPNVEPSKYVTPPQPTEAAQSNEWMSVRLRYKQPDSDTSVKAEYPIVDEETAFSDADDDVRFAAAVASFGMQLRGSKYVGSWTLNDVIETAQSARGEDRFGLRAEFIELVKQAKRLRGE